MSHFLQFSPAPDTLELHQGFTLSLLTYHHPAPAAENTNMVLHNDTVPDRLHRFVGPPSSPAVHEGNNSSHTVKTKMHTNCTHTHLLRSFQQDL